MFARDAVCVPVLRPTTPRGVCVEVVGWGVGLRADVGVLAEPCAGWIETFAAVGNMGKGAQVQAIQAQKLMLGLPKGTGLTAPAAYP